MKKLGLVGIGVLLLVLTAARTQRPELSDEQKFLNAMHQEITSQKLFDYVVELSDEALEGRLAGSPGMAKAVDIVQGYFKDFGLLPAGEKGEYLQVYPHPHVEIQEGSTMQILFPMPASRRETVWVAKEYPWADGWFAGNASGNGDITAEVVYAGFGVSASELGYDDYKGIDVKGKIVLVEGETPNRSRNPDSLALWYNHTLHQTKLATAARQGAIGMLYKWVPGPNALYNPDFVYCHVTQDVVDDIFLGTGKTYKETINGIYKNMKPASFATGKKARIKMNSVYHPESTGKNILGYVKGSDPVLAEEYVVISAHLDHLGMIPYHIEGANDNNASTAAMLGVAEALAKAEVKPKRSVLFMSLDGEEAGLTGSTYYVENPLIPMDKITAIINLEQVGAGELLGAGYAYTFPGLLDYAQKANDQYVHRQLYSTANTFRTRPRTDGAVFMKAGYPCIDVRAVGGGFYHHPKDNTGSINPEILQSAAQWIYWMAVLLANADDPDLTQQ